jgi:hypothetical protein
MYLTVMIIACIANALVTIVSFFLYVRARLTIREQTPEHTDQEHAQRLSVLDRREQRYQSIHFITLALFVLFGVLILVHLSGKLNQPTITKARPSLLDKRSRLPVIRSHDLNKIRACGQTAYIQRLIPAPFRFLNDPAPQRPSLHIQ